MEQAIQKAIEGGWKPKDFPLTEEPSEQIGIRIVHQGEFQCYNKEYPEEGYNYEAGFEIILLDPLFWQALGKAMGWYSWVHGHVTDSMSYHPECGQCHWHRFIDHLAEGKPTESFFADLLDKPIKK